MYIENIKLKEYIRAGSISPQAQPVERALQGEYEIPQINVLKD